MTSTPECPSGLVIRGVATPRSLREFKLLAFGMDSALLYPGAEELVAACTAAGMEIQLAIGELSDGDAKLAMLQSTCSALKITPAQAIVLGHNASDLPLLRAAGLSATYHADPAIAEHAMVNIQTGGFDRLLEVLSRHNAAEVLGLNPGLDLSVLDALVGHDAAKFQKFARLFMDSMETVMAEIDTAIAQENLSVLVAMGHRAKSTALSIGAAAFSQQCLLMEKAACAQDGPAALRIARTLRPQFAATCSAIEQRLAAD